MPIRKNKKPAYCCHKRTNRAYVRIDGKQIYLGDFNSDESHQRYEELIAQWEMDQERTVHKRVTVGELCVIFMKHAETYYSKGEFANFKVALRPLIKLFRSTLVSEFGPRKLAQIQDKMAEKHVREKVNQHIGRIRRVFKYGVSHELVDDRVLFRLRTLEPLKRGRTKAKESEEVKAVPQEHIEAVLPYLTKPVAAMVQLQAITGMRPGEVLSMKLGEIDQSGDVWIYTPAHHKNSWRGKQRFIPIGPQARGILEPFIADAVRNDQYVFRSSQGRKEFVEGNYRDGAKARTRNADGNQNKPYVRTGYSASIARACKRAGVPHFSPNQLRHSAATTINRTFGDIDASRVVLGHSEATTTQRYAERDLQKAIEIARQIG